MKKISPFILAIPTLLILLITPCFAEKAARPSFSPEPGEYNGSVTVTISTSTGGAIIRYTTDGTKPKKDSPVYTSPLKFETTTKLKARAFMSGLTASGVAKATFKIELGVSEVVFEEINSPLDDNPFEMGGGKRIFPERQTADDTTVRNTVRVRATINPPREDIRVYFRNFDLDDPSLDPLLDVNGAEGNDNFPDTPIPISPELPPVLPPAGVLNATSALTDKNGQATVILTVIRQPGNNFAVTATIDQLYDSKLALRKRDGSIIEDESGSALPTTKAKRTPMLTVWRRVHIEVDRMAKVTGNTITGTVAKITPDSPEAGQTTVDLGLNLPAPGDMGTDGLLNRFEGGTITLTIGINNQIFLPFPFDVLSNTANPTGNDRVVVEGIVDPRVAEGRSYVLVDDDKKHGFGDDIEIPFPDTGRLEECFKPAYIIPVFDLQNPNPIVPFVLNITAASASALIPNYRFDNSATEVSSEFWTVYILGALQYTTVQDGDGDDKGPNPCENGCVTSGVADKINGIGAHIFLEGINEVVSVPRKLTTSLGQGEQDIVVHEVGHLFSADHPDGGLMDQMSDFFSSKSLRNIRKVFHP